MYCSLRYYIADTPSLTNPHTLLKLFEIFAHTSHIPYDFISYTLFDPDRDTTLIDETFLYKSTENTAFLATHIFPLVSGKDGDLSSPFICATCHTTPNQLYSKIRVQVQYPVYSLPLILRVDCEELETFDFSFEKYIFLLKEITSLGFRVNNSFYHLYNEKKEAITLDGGQMGSLASPFQRENIDRFLIHRKADCLNRCMNIYCINSIQADLLSDNVLNKIRRIVGYDKVIISDNIISFALDDMKKISSTYRLKYRKTIKELKRLLIH